MTAITFVVAADEIFDSSIIYRFENVLFKGRLLSFAVGASLGVFAYLKRIYISNLVTTITSERSSWAVQLCVGIALLMLLVAIFAPNVFNRLESFKAGEVEAKFARQQAAGSAAVETIRFAASDFYQSQSLLSWADFGSKYASDTFKGEDCIMSTRPMNGTVDPKMFADTRREVMKYFAHEDEYLNNRRIRIAGRLLSYINPVLCYLKEKDRFGEVDDMRHDTRMLHVSYQLRRYILDPLKAENYLYDALRTLNEIKCGFKEAAPGSTCVETEDQTSDEVDAVSDALDGKPEALDPYLVSLVGDMLAFFSDSDAEAEFLDALEKRYPADANHLHPGLVNFYSVVASAKLRGELAWPIENLTEELDRAELINDAIIRQGADHIKDVGKCPAQDEKVDSPISEQIDATRACEIVDTYLKNQATLDWEHLKMHIDYQVHGAAFDENIRSDWKRHFESLAAIMNAIDGRPPVSIDGLLPTALSPLEKARWASIKVFPDERFDWYSTLALSSVLLSEKEDGGPIMPCTAAAYYLTAAEKQIPSLVVDMVPEKTSSNEGWPTDDLRETNKLRLRGYLKSFQHRVEASCQKN